MEKPNLTSSNIVVFMIIIIIVDVVCHFHYDTETCFMACADSFFLDLAFSLMSPLKWFVWSMNENLLKPLGVPTCNAW